MRIKKDQVLLKNKKTIFANRPESKSESPKKYLMVQESYLVGDKKKSHDETLLVLLLMGRYFHFATAIRLVPFLTF